jgi:hypothetical protein
VGDDYQLIHADVATLPAHVAPQSVELILTDPPYGRDAVPLYGRLAAAVCLKPGGSLIAMCGQSYLPELLTRMSPHLRYHWLLASRLSGPGIAVWARRIHNHWRAWLWYVQGTYTGDFQGDFLQNDVPDKRYHHWGQGISPFAELIQRLTRPGALVCDPFCGGGTTGKAAVLLGRRFVGLDCDAATLERTARRLQRLSEADTVQSSLELVESSLRWRPCRWCGRC